MKIGIDARVLASPLTGIGRYNYEIVRHLNRADLNIFLYSPRPITLPGLLTTNAVIRTQNLKSRLARMLWSQTVLPYWALKDKIDLFWGTSHRLPTLLPKKMASVVTIHDMVWKRAPTTMRPLSLATERLLMPRALQAADLIIADSCSTARDIAHYYAPQAPKVHVVPLAAARLQFQNKVSLIEMGIKKPYLLFVGTLEPRKNILRLIKGFSLLPKDIIEKFHLVICGAPGWGRINVKKAVQEQGIENHVIITGAVTDETLASLYNQAYCLVMPSLYEGFGLPILEAQTWGVPVITSSTSAMPEVAGEAAIYVDPFDVQDIASALHKILGDPTLRETLSHKAQRNAARFSWETAAEQTLAIFTEAVKIKHKKCHR